MYFQGAVQQSLPLDLEQRMKWSITAALGKVPCIKATPALPTSLLVCHDASLRRSCLCVLMQMCIQTRRFGNANNLLKRLAFGCKGTPPAEAVMDVVETFILVPPSQHDPNSDMPSIEALCEQLHGAKDIISSREVADLVSQALQLRHDEHAMGLLRLPGAKQLEPDQIEQLLQQAIQLGSSVYLKQPPSQVVKELCALPEAAKLSPSAVEHLLHLAIQQQATFRDFLYNNHNQEAQYREPQDKDISWQAEWDNIVLQLCRLSAAAGYNTSSIRSFLQLHLQPAPVAELLQTAIQLKNPTAVVELCVLPGAAGVDAAMAAELLVAAAVQQQVAAAATCSNESCGGAAAAASMRKIGPDSTKRILELVVQHTHGVGTGSEACQSCCPLFLGAIGLPAGPALSSSDIKQLMALAGEHGNAAAVQILQTLLIGAYAP